MHAGTLTTLATGSTQSGGSLTELLFIIAVFIGLVVAGAVIAMLVKRSLDRGVRDAGSQALGLMEQMRTMNRRGELSDEEFARAKQILADRASGVPPEEARRRAEEAARRAAGILVAESGKDLTGAPLPPAVPSPDSGTKPPDPDTPQAGAPAADPGPGPDRNPEHGPGGGPGSGP